MILLERSKFYSIHQSNQDRCYYVNLGQKVLRLSFCQLLAMRQKVNALELDTLFDADLNKHGFEILTLCNNQHLFILNIYEILDLKSLMQNTFAAMGLSARIIPVSA